MNGNACTLYQEKKPKNNNNKHVKLRNETMFRRFSDIMTPLSRNRKKK